MRSGLKPLDRVGQSGWNLAGISESLALLGIALWALLVFSGWGVAQWLTGAVQTHWVVVEPYYQFSDKASWLPLALEVAGGNIFPSSGLAGDGPGFLPYLALWAYGLLIAVFGVTGVTIVGQTLFATGVFMLAAMIYRQYLPRRWAFTLAALGTVSFSSYPLRQFLGAIIEGNGWLDVGTIQPPDVLNMPFPALSAFSFLLVLYLSLRWGAMTTRRATFLTVLWALQSQVHVVNVLLGLPVWFTLLSLRWWRQSRGDPAQRRAIPHRMLGQGMLALAVCLPSVIGYARMSGSDLGQLGGSGEPVSELFGIYYYVAYFVVPTVTMAVVFFVQRVDFYELVFKFWLIYLFMFLEAALTSAYLIANIGLPPDLIFSRASMLFLHMLYYVPVVYYLIQPGHTYHWGTERSALAHRVRAGFAWFIGEASIVYLPMLFVVLTFFAFANAHQAYMFAKERRGPAEREVVSATAVLTADAAPGHVLVAEQQAVDFNLMLDQRYSTLWVNRFVTPVPAEEAIERLALHAHLVGWSEEQFAEFMRPSTWPAALPDGVVDVAGRRPVTGLGYWLVYHRLNLPPSAAEDFRIAMKRRYAEIDIGAAARKYRISLVLASQPLPNGLPAEVVRKTPVGTLYRVAR